MNLARPVLVLELSVTVYKRKECGAVQFHPWSQLRLHPVNKPDIGDCETASGRSLECTYLKRFHRSQIHSIRIMLIYRIRSIAHSYKSLIHFRMRQIRRKFHRNVARLAGIQHEMMIHRTLDLLAHRKSARDILKLDIHLKTRDLVFIAHRELQLGISGKVHFPSEADP